MERLPNELLLIIASCLSPQDLGALALVSKQFLPIAQEHIYTLIQISTTVYDAHGDKDTPLTDLFRTLIKNSKLASFVRQLEVHLQERYVEMDYTSLLPDQSEEALQILRTARPHVTQYAIVALILERTENLRLFDYESVTTSADHPSEYDQRHFDLWSLADVLRGPYSSSEAWSACTFPHVRGLLNLEEIKFRGGCVDFTLVSLPSLKKVSIGSHAIFPDNEAPESVTCTNDETM